MFNKLQRIVVTCLKVHIHEHVLVHCGVYILKNNFKPEILIHSKVLGVLFVKVSKCKFSYTERKLIL